MYHFVKGCLGKKYGVRTSILCNKFKCLITCKYATMKLEWKNSRPIEIGQQGGLGRVPH